GATLLHLCVEFDELEIARWLLSRGMPVDAPASTDSDGFGGHSALFNAVVCYANFWDNFFDNDNDSPFAKLLLENGANPNARASLREHVLTDDVVTIREHRDITALEWGKRFHNRIVVSKPAMRRIAARGGE
ncbi:MAG: ankyrin repeat domain-containing protein, partial [Gemmatimonadaceae bacterium]